MMKMVRLPLAIVTEQVPFVNVIEPEITLVHVPNFWGVAGSEDFACATLPTTPLTFKAKFNIFVTLPSQKSDLR